MISLAFNRLRYAFPFLVATASLALTLWAAGFQLKRGYEGFDWTPLSGTVLDVDPLGPAAGSFRVGDRIVSVEGLPANLAPPIYARIGPGDTIHYEIERDRSEFALTLELTSLPPRVAFQFVMPLAVAAAFWLIGVAVLAAFGRPTVPVISLSARNQYSSWRPWGRPSRSHKLYARSLIRSWMSVAVMLFSPFVAWLGRAVEATASVGDLLRLLVVRGRIAGNIYRVLRRTA